VATDFREHRERREQCPGASIFCKDVDRKAFATRLAYCQSHRFSVLEAMGVLGNFDQVLI